MRTRVADADDQPTGQARPCRTHGCRYWTTTVYCCHPCRTGVVAPGMFHSDDCSRLTTWGGVSQ